MTQGYGPQDGQQGQWGQGDQNAQPPWGQNPQDEQPAVPQWGESPQQSAPQPQSPSQWGQAGPAPASPWSQSSPAPGTGYPGDPAAGAAGYSSPMGTGGTSTLGKLVNWMLYLVIAVIAVRVIHGIVAFGIGFVGGLDAGGPMEAGPALAGGGVVVNILFLLLNIVVSLALLVIAIWAVVQASGRGRTGAIIVAATVIVAVVLYWILYGIYVAIIAGAADMSTLGVLSIVYAVLEILRNLLVFAALIVGAVMARRWAKQNA